MSLLWRSGTFTKRGDIAPASFDDTPVSTAAGNALPFTPKLIIFWTSGQSTASAAHMRHGFGWTTGATANYCMAFGSDDAQPASTVDNNTFRGTSDGYCLRQTTSATLSVQFKLKTFNPDGFTITYDNNNSSTYPIHYLAIGGTDIVSAKAGSFTPNTTTGNQDITVASGFSTDCVLFFGTNSPTIPTPTTSIPHATWFLGAAKSSTERWSTSGISREVTAVNSDNSRYQRTDKCIVQFAESSSLTIDMEADYVSSITNGFRINITDPPASANPIFYLAIQGGSWNVGEFTHRSTVGSQAITGTDTSFTPKGVFLATHRGSNNGAIQRNHAFAWGSGSSSTQVSCVFGDDKDNVPTTISGRGTSNGTSIIRLITSQNDGTTDTWDDNAIANLTSLDATGGFTLDWTTVDPATPRQLLYFTAGDSPTGTSLVKLPATTPESVQVTEPTIIRRRAMMRQPSTTPETINLTEATPVKSLGKVKVIGGITGDATNYGIGFTDTGFTASGFITTFEHSADFVGADFLSADFITVPFEAVGPPLVPPEGLAITETVSKILSLDESIITASNLLLRFSGGASYNGNLNGGITSLGGAISATVVTSGVLDTAWDDVAFSEATSGKVEFRCFYLYNNHASLTAYSVDMWIDMNTPGGDTIEIGVGAANVNATEAALSPLAENTVPPAPVTFSLATDADSAIHLGNIPAAGYKSFWIKRNVPAGVLAWNDNSYTIRISFVSDHL